MGTPLRCVPSLAGRLHYMRAHQTAPRMGKACGSRLLPGRGTCLQVGSLSPGHLPWPTRRQEHSLVLRPLCPSVAWHSRSLALLLLPSLENTWGWKLVLKPRSELLLMHLNSEFCFFFSLWISTLFLAAKLLSIKKICYSLCMARKMRKLLKRKIWIIYSAFQLTFECSN